MVSENGAIIIAGASGGLGKQIAYDAVNNGYHVALISRSSDDLKRIHKDLPLCSAHLVDLANFCDVEKEFFKIAKLHRKIFALVNCAATWTGSKSIFNITTEYMQNSFRDNFFTAFNTIKAILNMRSQFQNIICNVVNIGATSSIRGSRNCSAFTAAKGALRQFSQSLSKELGPEGIHVSHVIIDGLLNNARTRTLNPELSDDYFIDMKSLSKDIFHILNQDKSCWTFELDVRPFNEKW